MPYFFFLYISSTKNWENWCLFAVPWETTRKTHACTPWDFNKAMYRGLCFPQLRFTLSLFHSLPGQRPPTWKQFLFLIATINIYENTVNAQFSHQDMKPQEVNYLYELHKSNLALPVLARQKWPLYFPLIQEIPWTSHPTFCTAANVLMVRNT